MFAIILVIVCSILIAMAYTSYQMDFRAFYIAAKSFRAGINPYENNLGVSEEFFDPFVLRQDSKYIYPPPSLLLISPLGLFSYKISKMIYSSLVLIVLLITLILLKKRYPINDAVFLLLPLTFPVLANFERGQIDIIILFLIIMSFFHREKWFSPLLLAIAISLKLIPCVLLFYYLIFARDVRYVLKSIAFTALIFLTGLFATSTSIFLDFFYRLFSGFYVDKIDIFTMPKDYSLIGRIIVTPDGIFNFTHGFVHKHLNPLFGLDGASYILAFVFFLLVLLMLKRNRVREEETFFALLIVIMSFNRLLWIMGMVYYLPLFFLYMHRLTLLRHRFLVLLPLIFPKNPLFPVLNNSYNFVIALFVVYIFTLSRADAVADPASDKYIYDV